MERAEAWSLAALAALLFGIVSPWWSATPDSVVYLSMARAIAETGRAEAFGSPHTGLPPGYPALLASAFLFGERPFFAISLLQWALGVVALAGIWKWAHRLAPDAALAVTALVAVNVSFWIHARRPLSEVAFLALLVWSANAFERAFNGASARSALVRMTAVIPLLLATVLVREVGLVLVSGFALAALLSRDRPLAVRASIVAIPAFVAATAVVLYLLRDQATIEASDAGRALGTHLDGFLDPRSSLAAKAGEGFRLRVAEIGRLLVPGMFKAYAADGRWLDWNTVVYAPVSVVVLVGWARMASRRPDALLLSLPAYLLVYCAWPFDAGTRYLLPVLPVLVLSLWPWIEASRRRFAVIATLVAAHLAVTIGYTVTREIPRARDCDGRWPVVEAKASELRESPPAWLTPTKPECEALMLSFLLDRPVDAR